jgi:hypothetical protein
MVIMFFQFSSEVAGLAAHVGKDDALEFCFDGPTMISVRLSKNYPDGLKPRDPLDAVCTSTTTVEPPDAKIAAELKEGWAPPVVNGKVKQEDATLEFVDGVLARLEKLMKLTVTLFRWRQGIAEGPPNPCNVPQARYSENGGVWHGIFLVRGVKITWGLAAPSAPENNACREVVELAGAGTEEPLGRQLFREAWIQRKSNPRSALVIGVAAAEVGFKKLVGTLVPQAQWLVDEVQTPSLSKMLSKFLPTLPVKAGFLGKSIRPPKALLRQLDKAVERRNKLVHAGQPPPGWDELEEMLRAINDFLWICDVYQGHVWAAKHISIPTQKAWGSDRTQK